MRTEQDSDRGHWEKVVSVNSEVCLGSWVKKSVIFQKCKLKNSNTGTSLVVRC